MSPNLIPETSDPGRAPVGTLKLFAQGGVAKTVDPNGSQKTLRVVEDEDADFATNIAAYMALRAPYDGEPVNYVAAVAATPMTSEGADYTVDTNKTVRLTAKVAGVLDPAPKLVVTAANALPAGALASLAITSQTANTVTVRPATSAGAFATHVLSVGAGGGTKTITSTIDAAAAAGTAGNTWSLEVMLPTTEPGIDPFTTPSAALAATVASGAVIVTLATTAGTAGVVTITEDVVTDPGTVTITQKAAYVGTWGATPYVTADIVHGVPSGNLTVTAAEVALVAKIHITLGMTAAGVPDNAKNTATLLAAAINTALETVSGSSVGDWSDYLLAEVGEAGVFESAAAETGMTAATGGTTPVNAVRVNGSANQADEVAAVIAAVTGIGTSVVGSGAGNEEVNVTAAANFTGGGANSAITSTLADLTTLLHAAPSTIIDCEAGAGLQTALLEATAGVTLTGGTNLVPAVPGTPAYFGRLATDGTDAWMAMVEDPTTTQHDWVKITA